MKSFFSNIISSFIGVVLASIALGFLLITLIVGLFVSIIDELENGTNVQALEEQSVMIVKLNYPIAEKTSDDPFDHYDFNTMESRLVLGLDDIVDNIQRSSLDPKIAGIYLNLDSMGHGWASTESIRTALLDFKKSGKWIIAYSEYYSHESYYLSSVADELYLNPAGVLQFQGLNSQSLFLKDTLAKLDIDMQVLRGPNNEYKSAVETFTHSEMSENSRRQTQILINEIWANTIKHISESRSVSESTLNQIANNLSIDSAQAAVDYQLIDGLRYQDEVRETIKEKMKLAKNKTIPAINLEDYAGLHKDKNLFSEISPIEQGDKIAVIYADGDIMSGESERGTVGSSTTAYAIRSARENKNVKAMVLRINSPGGSALAADVILREVYLSAQEKPVIISFGNVAASGGYYIAAAGSKIFAEPTTITGSIGVFSLVPNFQGFLNNKLGVHFDNVNTHAYSDFGNTTQALKPFEKQQLQKQLEKVYSTFKAHVAQGRSLSDNQVEEIAKGRVWSGIAAKNIGLVDELGGLKDAINEAATMANISDYDLLKLPKEDSPFNLFVKNSADYTRSWLLNTFFTHPFITNTFSNKQLKPMLEHYQMMKELQLEQGVQARMPFSLQIE